MIINIRTNPNVVYTYIGRAGHGLDGYFGNPVVPGIRCPQCRLVHGAPGSTIACFELYARARLAADPVYAARVRELHGKVLGCFCSPRPCHGHVLEQLAAELNGAAVRQDEQLWLPPTELDE